jgi:hypothetical protein
MKQQAAAFAAFGLFFVLWKSRGEGWRSVALKGAVFSAGAAAPYALLCAYLAANGVFANFWFWTVAYAGDYARLVPLRLVPGILLKQAGEAINWNGGVWALAGAGAVIYFLRGRDRDTKAFLGGFAAFSFLAVCPGFFFRSHYFIVMLPAVGLCAGAGAAALSSGDPGGGVGRGRGAWTSALVAALAVSVLTQASAMFSWDLGHVSRYCYGGNPFLECVEVARYIEANSSPADTIAVLGSEPEVYFYAHRRSAARYVYAYALMEPHPYSGRLQDQVIREIEAAKPRFIVFVRVPTSWLVRPESEKRILSWMESYAAANYDMVGVAEVTESGASRYTWGPDAPGTASATNRNAVLVLKRRG